MRTNLKLAIAAVLLLAGSIWVYADSVSRGDRFERGKKLLPNLAIDEVSTIVLTEGGKTTTLERSAEPAPTGVAKGESFTIAEVHDYPAKNEAVNRLLRDLLDIGLEKEIGNGADLAKELEIDPPTDTTTEVVAAQRRRRGHGPAAPRQELHQRRRLATCAASTRRTRPSISPRGRFPDDRDRPAARQGASSTSRPAKWCGSRARTSCSRPPRRTRPRF